MKRGSTCFRCRLLVRGAVLSRAALVLALLGTSWAAAQDVGPSSFIVLVKGTRVGTVQSDLQRTADGWRVTGTSRLGPPLNLTLKRLEIAYDARWNARYVNMEMVTPTRSAIVNTAFQNGTAYTDIVFKGEVTSEKARVAEDTIVLPNLVFGSYEALAARLLEAKPGQEFRRYIMPQGEITVHVEGVTNESLKATRGMVRARRWQLTFLNPVRAYTVELWEAGGRLVQLSVPSQDVSVMRSDLSRTQGRSGSPRLQ